MLVACQFKNKVPSLYVNSGLARTGLGDPAVSFPPFCDFTNHLLAESASANVVLSFQLGGGQFGFRGALFPSFLLSCMLLITPSLGEQAS